ncbi:MAG TPA: M20 aminoacylase family protein [Gammaproteobacteria bacterium]|nr:M20 aminoacylase family protein [Gammaproteobacteria bacterium]
MSGLVDELSALQKDLTGWRHALHQMPEIGFAERETAAYVVERLREFGLDDVQQGLAETGVVATLNAGNGAGRIALRADIDALPIEEANEVDYRSRNAGHMHACGHDGHTAMLLGAARYLAEHKGFNGTVDFIFQPAEEGWGGGARMIEEGLFERFPAHSVFGMHNWPGVPAGQFAIRPGPMMASDDIFEITVKGVGTHAAMPNLGRDPLVAASHIVTALQTLPSRSVSPTDALVVSVTQIHGGTAWNVIPDEAVIRGTVRTLRPVTRDGAEAQIGQVVAGVCSALGVGYELDYTRRYPVTMNHPEQTEFAAQVATSLVGQGNVRRDMDPGMGAEDFAFMLQARPGAYIWIGNDAPGSDRRLHNPHYDFNDSILALGAAYWVELVRAALPA